MPTRKRGDGAGSPPIARDNGRETSQSPLRSESASARTDFGWAAANARLHARGRVAGIWPWSAQGSRKQIGGEHSEHNGLSERNKQIPRDAGQKEHGNEDDADRKS